MLDFYLKLNGRDIGELSCALIEGVSLGTPTSGRELAGLPGRVGVSPDQVSTGVPRRIVIPLALRTSTDITVRQERLDDLLGWVRRPGLTEIELGTSTDRVFWGLLQDTVIDPRWKSVAWTAGPARVTLVFLVPAGVAHAKALSSVGLSADTWTDLQGLGTAPSEPRIFIPGPVVDPVLEVARPDGTVEQELTLSGTVATGGWWEVDSATRRVIERVATGERSDVTGDVYSSGSWPVFDPSFGTESLVPMARFKAGRIISNHTSVAYYKANWS